MRKLLLPLSLFLCLPLIAQESSGNDLERDREQLTSAYEEQSERTARAIDQDREFALQQQAALESIDMLQLEGFESQLGKLEARMELLERDLKQSREVTRRLRTLDSVRNALQLTSMQADYFAAMETIERIYTESDELRSRHDWDHYVDDLRQLSDPQTYEGFTEGLIALQEEQKNSLQLPDMGLLGKPHAASFYTLTTALGTKGEPEEIVKVQRLACMLDFAMQAERQLDYIASEVAFARAVGDELHERATDLRKSVYDLVNLDPGKLDRAHVSFFRQQFTADFVSQDRQTIQRRQAQVEDLDREFTFYRRYLDMAMRKVKFALESIKADCGEGLEELEVVLEGRKG